MQKDEDLKYHAIIPAFPSIILPPSRLKFYHQNRQLLNQTVPVLIEGVSPESDLLLSGRTAAMAPDVDGHVLINKGQGLEGEITPVLIKEAYAYDLVGEII